MVAIPSLSSSSALVNDQERRVRREMEHLLSDIRRINPQGAPHCTFGELFIDPGVEQYYEALVGTMRAAKRNKLITFKGQFLLKGMHDDVIVRIVDGNDDGTAPVNNETTIASASGDNTTKAPSEAQTHDHNRRTTQRRKSSKPVIVLDKNLKQSIFRGNMNLCKNDDDASVATEPSRMPYRANLRTRSMPIGGRHHTRIAQIAHTVSAGIAFQSNQNTETHFERVDREVNQLLVDILRIAPEGNPFCTFGLLFEDPQVEQYYEALVGTLKSAKRKGLIRFKGQMLLKGMHDNVQIDIVK